MAQKRMFSLLVTNTDRFLEMPLSSQALYFHLGMNGDDDGFVACPKRILRMAGGNDDDLRILASRGYVIPFDSGVVVIADWKINNTLKNDRYHETLCLEEKALLSCDKTGRYVLRGDTETQCLQPGTNLEPTWNHVGTMLEPEPNITELNGTEQNTEMGDKPPTRPRFTPPTMEEVAAYCAERGNGIDAEKFVDFYMSNGWKVGRNPMRDWRAAVRTWEKGSEEHGKHSGRCGATSRNWGIVYD